MKIYVILDLDLGAVVGVLKDFRSVWERMSDTASTCGYPYYEVRDNDDQTGWLITFPHDDPKCEGHYEVVETEVED